MEAEGELLHHAGPKIVLGEVSAVAPAGLTVVRSQDLMDFSLLGTLLLKGVEQPVFARRYREIALGYAGGKKSLLAEKRVAAEKVAAARTLARVPVAVALRHPVDRAVRAREHLAVGGVLYLRVAGHFSVGSGVSVTDGKVPSACREADPGAVEPYRVGIERIDVASVFAKGYPPIFFSFDTDLERVSFARNRQHFDHEIVGAGLEPELLASRFAVHEHSTVLKALNLESRFRIERVLEREAEQMKRGLPGLRQGADPLRACELPEG